MPCPHCGERVKWTQRNPWRPFCSERCKLIDFGDWADERHRIPEEADMSDVNSDDVNSNDFER